MCRACVETGSRHVSEPHLCSLDAWGARACPWLARACPCASVSVHERVISRPPEEGEVSHPISGIGLGVMPVRPHTPRRSVLTSSRWTDPNPSSSAMGAAPHHVGSEAVAPMAWRTDPSVCPLEVCGIL